MKEELYYQVKTIPDLSLNKYASLEGSGVEGVLEKHIAFLRQWNRKGALSGTSIHLFYYYDGRGASGECGVGEKGNKLEILFLVRGEEEQLRNVPELVSASALSDYFGYAPYSYEAFAEDRKLRDTSFSICSTLVKKEVFIRSSLDSVGEDGGYYTVPQWEINERGRLYSMSKLMESLDKRLLYRVDFYPVEKSEALRGALRKPMSILRERQYARIGASGQRDYEAENVLRGYEELLSSMDSSPHFIANLFMFGNDREDTTVALDAAGAEALKKGSYEIASFCGAFTPRSFLEADHAADFFDARSRAVLQASSPGMLCCKEDSKSYKLKYLPTLFTLEEAAPFFRFPALYEGEVIQKRKETAPQAIAWKRGLYLGTDDNGYEIYFPLRHLTRHAFVAGVPGAGKTNALCHIASTLWRTFGIPFLVLEPAKQEYRALANQKGMEGLHVFSPNAEMLFPLHINPFEFPRGLMLAEHIRRLVAVFEGAFPMEGPMPFLLDTAIEAVYRQLGWTPETVHTAQTRLKFPTMSMLYRQLENELKSTRYSEEIRGNLESALKVRIGSLLRREMGGVFDVPNSSIPPEEWLSIPAVIELESMGTGPSNFLTLMLCTLIREALKANPLHNKDYARHVIFIEEAHNLIGPEAEETYGAEANPKQAATAFIVKMLAEVRALKEGIIIADQLPTVMAQEVIKNTGLKIGLKITSSDDRVLLCSTMAANAQQMEEMATFGAGRALISYEGLMKPFTMQMHEWCGSGANDCIRDSDERMHAVTPLADQALCAHMREWQSYRRICQRSFEIESTRFNREYSALSERVNDIIAHIKTLNDKDVAVKKLEERVVEMSQELLAMPDWEDKQDKINAIQNTADYVAQLKYELRMRYLTTAKFRGAYEAIVDCIQFARRIQDRKKHWITLGVTDFAAIGKLAASTEPLSKTQHMVKGVNNMQQAAILFAQRLYIVARPHMAHADKVCEQIRTAAETFKVKNLLTK